jgi:AraC-like DNA-binding protein
MGKTKRRRSISRDQRDRPAFESLRTLGVGVELFPHYQTVGGMHEHDFVEMNLIAAGRGRQRIEDQWYDIERGWLSVIHYDQAHALVGAPDGLEIINVYLDPGVFPLPELPDRLQRVLPAVVPLHPEFRHRQNRLVAFALAEPETPISLLRLLERELRTQPAGYRQAVQNYMTLFLTECCRQYLQTCPNEEDAEPVLPPSASTSIERMRRHLDAHFTEPLKLGDLADRAGCSPTHLCRLFRAYTGRSVFGYLKQRRIERAMLLLRSTRKKVLAIAFDSGFFDLSHFNRTFRNVIGVSPRAYRNQWRTDEKETE